MERVFDKILVVRQGGDEGRPLFRPFARFAGDCVGINQCVVDAASTHDRRAISTQDGTTAAPPRRACRGHFRVAEGTDLLRPDARLAVTASMPTALLVSGFTITDSGPVADRAGFAAGAGVTARTAA